MSFTGGMSVKCVAAAAIKISDDHKYQYYASTNALQEIQGKELKNKLGYDEDTQDSGGHYWEIDSREGRSDRMSD